MSVYLPAGPAIRKTGSGILQSEIRSRDLGRRDKTAVHPSLLSFTAVGMDLAKGGWNSDLQLKEKFYGPDNLDSRDGRPWLGHLGFPVLVRGCLRQVVKGLTCSY